jgi:hypothetical protein
MHEMLLPVRCASQNFGLFCFVLFCFVLVLDPGAEFSFPSERQAAIEEALRLSGAEELEADAKALRQSAPLEETRRDVSFRRRRRFDAA